MKSPDAYEKAALLAVSLAKEADEYAAGHMLAEAQVYATLALASTQNTTIENLDQAVRVS